MENYSIQKTMENINIATKNTVKIEAIKSAFERYFGSVEIQTFSTPSGVPEQPLNDEVFMGAQNRLNAMKENANPEEFLISCEGGIICQFGHYFNVQVVLVEKNGKRGFGLSQGYEIPKEYVEEALQTSIANVLDRLFEGKGGIRVLSKGAVTRKQLVEDATIMALTRLLNGEVW